MKQVILNALKAKFIGVSEQILDRVATKLAQTVTTAEQVQTAVDGVTFQQVLESYGDSRATQAQQTAVHNYEQKYGLKDGSKIDTGQQQQQLGGGSQTVPPVVPNQTAGQQQTGGGAQDATNALLSQLLEQNKKLNERLDRMDVERTTASRKTQISTLIDKLPDSLKKAYARTPVDNLSDDEFNALVGEITTEVGEISSSITQKGAVFGHPAAQNGGLNQGAELSKEQEAAISHREGTSKDGQQPF